MNVSRRTCACFLPRGDELSKESSDPRTMSRKAGTVDVSATEPWVASSTIWLRRSSFRCRPDTDKLHRSARRRACANSAPGSEGTVVDSPWAAASRGGGDDSRVPAGRPWWRAGGDQRSGPSPDNVIAERTQLSSSLRLNGQSCCSRACPIDGSRVTAGPRGRAARESIVASRAPRSSRRSRRGGSGTVNPASSAKRSAAMRGTAGAASPDRREDRTPATRALRRDRRSGRRATCASALSPSISSR